MKSFLLSICTMAAMTIGLSCPAVAQQGSAASSDSLITRSTIKDNTIFWQQDRLVQHKNGRLFEVTEPVEYQNGTRVYADGRVRTPDGNTQTLKKKHAISPQGRIVLVADDIFTHNTIVEHERKVVGDTGTDIIVVNGEITSITSGQNRETRQFDTGQQKKIQLMEQMIQLLEQRAALLETTLSASERRSQEAQQKTLNQQLEIVNQQLKALSAPVK